MSVACSRCSSADLRSEGRQGCRRPPRGGYGLEDFLTTHEPDQAAKPELAPDLWDFLDGPDPGYQWLMPGLLERGDRLMITGYEGWGKSVFTRQLALGSLPASTRSPARAPSPCRVLFIDCENSEMQLRRGL
jgi:hypothetical protein